MKHFRTKKLIAGCDEAGRGCLAGPVVAAAVILPKAFAFKSLNDSKKLTAKKRDELRLVIEREAIYGIGICSPSEIDKLNILWASVEAMHRALNQITLPHKIMVDGNKFKPYKDIDHECVVKGDAKIACIAAASILAKTYRDELMQELHSYHPLYDWSNNKGYPTARHRNALIEFGPTEHHRKSFKLKEQIELF